MKTARAASYFANRFVRDNWLWIALLLLILWLLPKLLNAYALIIRNAGEAIPKVLDKLNFPKHIGEAVAKVATKALTVLEKYPVLTFVVPALAWKRFPRLAAVLSLWGALDLFKGHEKLTVERSVSPTPADAPAGPVRDTDPFPPIIDDPFERIYTNVSHQL